MTFQSHLHISFQDEHVLLPFIRLNSFGGFFLAGLLTFVICLAERVVSVALEKQWEPYFLKLGRRRIAMWRTFMFSAVTFLRLSYMLISMTFNLGLLLIIVITLSAAQFFIELSNLPKPPSLAGMHEAGDYRPLLSHTQERQQHSLDSLKARSRSRSKPDNIFIHPTQSNVARADAVAMQMGLAHNVERVQEYRYGGTEPAWEVGKGKDLARELLSKKDEKQTPPLHQRQHSKDKFYIGASDSDSE
ncbi:hypothetical protein CPB83DRAFT_785610 [Crepidotus variabilis]|uniref:Copper transporter n=1 Tax=Crepidotus variabilis TaxID=179855 RepID=A0A9P6EN17_9AGAR|nr:hypothetical protein CPB83DRAFT_785610 [Crepidotus variabilis]